jgi:hypothetical protein
MASQTPPSNPPQPPPSSAFSITRQLYPSRLFPLSSTTTTTTTTRFLPAIYEDPSPSEPQHHATTTGNEWDIFHTMKSGQMSPTARSTAQFTSTSSWFPGTVQRHHLNSKDVGRNIQALQQFVRATRGYEEALRGVSDAAAGFAEALEGLARSKDLSQPVDEEEVNAGEEDDQDDIIEALRSLAAYQYYMASQQRVLAQLVHEQCTSPLTEQSQAYRHTLTVRKPSPRTALFSH